MPSPLTTRDRWRNIALDGLILPVTWAGPRHMVVDGETLQLARGQRRYTWRAERAVEVPLGLRAFRAHASGDVLEVGNVLHMYGASGHTVVDKYECAPGVLNVDIVGYDPGRRFDLVISISTLEHVGWDEEPVAPGKAEEGLAAIDRLGESLFATIPVGYHPVFEDAFVQGPFDRMTLMVRRSRLGRWEQRPVEERRSLKFGSPFTAGNGVLIGVRGRI